MCKYSHITLLENEGKKKKHCGEFSRAFWCHNNILVHTTGNQRHQIATIYFLISACFL